MKFVLTLLTIFTATSSFASDSPSTWQNKLNPFTSDGCSSFPDGLPFLERYNWRNCCVVHDIAYWQGGTAEQRMNADQDLRECVAEAGGLPLLPHAMYFGVRVGGFAGLPTSWHWGYGWTVPRGYTPLLPHEKRQVETLLQELPKDLQQIAIQSPGPFSQRETVSGDRCLDSALQWIQTQRGSEIEITGMEEALRSSSEGTHRTLRISLQSCPYPYVFEFLLLRDDACLLKSSELLARGRIRMLKTTAPAACSH